ncbi:MAG TPA: NifU family protein [Fimbriimonas sp.]
MSFLKRWLKRTAVDEATQGPLYREVREAMVDVQAYARSHGGEIRLISVSEEGDVRIKLYGTCRGCPMSAITIKLGVEQQLRRLVPGVRKVIQET